MVDLPRKFSDWPLDLPEQMATQDVRKLYENGFAGCTYQQDEVDKLADLVEWPDGDDAIHTFGLADYGKGKLSLPGKVVWDQYPNCWPGPGQTTGDCVSWGVRNPALTTICCEVAAGQPDETTGKLEGFPEVSAEAERNCVLSVENIYGARGHGGQGASCDRLAKYVASDGGLMLRQNYPELDLDLTKYNSSIGSRWGSRGTPDAVNQVGRQHQIRTVTTAKNTEAMRDFLANGYGLCFCSGLAWSSKRDENGFTKRSNGGWAHSQSVHAVDDRPEIHERYGSMLFLVLNSWGKWNGGGRKILNTNISIPEGSYWVKAADMDRCHVLALSSADGWKRQNLPDYGFSVI